MTVDERQTPVNLEAECSVLGAILATKGAALDAVADRLADRHFYRDAHQRIYRAMLALYERGEPIDFITLTNELKRRKDLVESGGPGYVASLVDGTPTSTNIGHYARIVKQLATKRDVIDLANRLLVKAGEYGEDPVALLNEAEQGLLSISESAVPGDLASPDEMVRRVLPVLDALGATGRPVTGLSTGLSSIDRYTRGLQPGNLIILAARPSQGKSTLASQIALRVAKELPVAFFSVEMSEQEQMFRALAHLASVDGHQLQCGQLSMVDQQLVGDAITDFLTRRFYLDESGGLSALQIRSKSRRIKAKTGLALIVVDYLQLLEHPRAESREQGVASTGRMLKRVARELEVPVLALCQLSRAVESRQDNRPKLSDLRESGSLEQDADVVLLIHRPQPKDHGGITEIPPTELIIAKQRNGPTASVELRWIGEQYRFAEIENR